MTVLSRSMIGLGKIVFHKQDSARRALMARKYYLHRKVKEAGFKLDVNLKTIYVPFNQPLDNSYVKMLWNEYDYSIQTEIV